jgi:hypothetical protein
MSSDGAWKWTRRACITGCIAAGAPVCKRVTLGRNSWRSQSVGEAHKCQSAAVVALEASMGRE